MMRLRQRQWTIWVRPFNSRRSSSGITTYSGVPYAPKPQGGGYSTLGGINEGMEQNSTIPIKSGCYVQWYTTTSFTKLKQKYKELLDLVPSTAIVVSEEVPMDTIIYPQS